MRGQRIRQLLVTLGAVLVASVPRVWAGVPHHGLFAEQYRCVVGGMGQG